MNCPFCYFPLIGTFDATTICGTCHAQFAVSLIVVSQPSPAWTADPNRRVNATGPAIGYCGRCHTTVPIIELQKYRGFCATCSKIVP